MEHQTVLLEHQAGNNADFFHNGHILLSE
jgi:hypothetical protein